MRVGIPTEIKNNENRVAITQAGVFELARRGHDVLVQAGAGLGSAITDEEYVSAGATIVEGADEVWAQSEMILKVKEPIAAEYAQMRKDQVLFTYLHLAASRDCTDAVLSSGTTAIAYETVQLPNRGLPLLAPMSEVAGRLSAQVGAYSLLKANGGRGVLLGGVTATRRGKVVVIGGGAAGEQAARIAFGMGAEVTVIDISIPRLKQLEDEFSGRIQTRTSNAHNITEALKEADLVIGSRWLPGGRIVGWPRYRRAISRTGTAVARVALRSRLRDITSGYRVFRVDALSGLELEEITSRGYGFQVELAWTLERTGHQLAEVPITFVERASGRSKMTIGIVWEALIGVLGWGLALRLRSRRERRDRRPR